MNKDLRNRAESDDLSSSLSLKLELPSDPKLSCVVRSVVETFAELLGFSDREGRSITRAVDEALTNVMRHSYGGDKNKLIEVHCRRARQEEAGEGREGLEIMLCDQGTAVDPTKLPARPLDEVRPGGLGLHVIRQSLDLVQYSRDEGVNRLRLVKFRSSKTCR